MLKPLAGAPLSPRETEILALLAKSLTVKEVAEALEISVRTVKFHTCRAREKSGARDRTGLMLWFAQAAPSAGADLALVALARVENQLAILSSAARYAVGQIERELEAATSARDSVAQLERAFDALKRSIAAGGQECAE